MKQYTITENNDWEGEVFGYIVYLTPDQFTFIDVNIKDIECLDIEESNYTESQVKQVNDHSENTYMPRLAFYRFKQDIFEYVYKRYEEIDQDDEITNKEDEKSWVFETEVFYKGGILKCCTKKQAMKNEKP